MCPRSVQLPGLLRLRAQALALWWREGLPRWQRRAGSGRLWWVWHKRPLTPDSFDLCEIHSPLLICSIRKVCWNMGNVFWSSAQIFFFLLRTDWNTECCCCCWVGSLLLLTVAMVTTIILTLRYCRFELIYFQCELWTLVVLDVEVLVITQCWLRLLFADTKMKELFWIKFSEMSSCILSQSCAWRK